MSLNLSDFSLLKRASPPEDWSCRICNDRSQFFFLKGEPRIKYHKKNNSTHYFHEICLDRWFKKQTYCPNCKFENAPFRNMKVLTHQVSKFSQEQENVESSDEDNAPPSGLGLLEIPETRDLVQSPSTSPDLPEVDVEVPFPSKKKPSTCLRTAIAVGVVAIFLWSN